MSSAPSGRVAGLALGLALSAGPAALAQEVPLRAGEHEGFTRLVLRVPDGRDWSLVPAPGGFAVKGAGPASFDDAAVFRRITRDRIAALETGEDGSLRLAVACDCHAEAFRVSDLGLVVDVRDGPPPAGDAAALAPGPAAPRRAADLPLFPAAAPPVASIPVGTPALPPGTAERIARTEAAILDSVAEAARHGILDLAPGVRAPEDGADPGETLVLRGRPGIAFRSGVETSEEDPLAATGDACIPDSALDLAAWADSGAFEEEVPSRLAALSDARDRLDTQAAEALARTYLAFGFGREARVALDLDGGDSRERDTLRTLARLLDGEPVAPDAFADQGACLGAVALWRALARGTLAGTGERERIAVSLAFRALPEGARRAVASRLAGLFLDAGDAAGAAGIAEQGAGADALLARAEIAEALDGPATALATLEAAAQGDARMTPEAMVELLDLLVAEGRAVGEDTLELARALRFEHDSRALLLAEARALAAGDRFEEALALLDGARATEPGPDLDATLTGTVDALAERLEDAPFLELALSGLPEDLPPEAGETVARRLTALGFPDEAWALRRPATSGPPGVAATPAPADPAATPTLLALTDPVPAPAPAAALPSPMSTPAPASPIPEVQAAAEAASPAGFVAAPQVVAPAPPTPVVIPPPPPALVETPEPTPIPSGVTSTDPPMATASASAAATPLGPPVPLDIALAIRPNVPPAPPMAEPLAAAPATVPPSPPLIPTPLVSGPTLAERRALLVEAEAAEGRASALLDQGLAP